MPMKFRVLGPVEAREDDRPVSLGRPKQRAVLAALLLHAGEAVPRARLIDELWGEQPPGSAVQSLQVYIHGLRQALGAERIETHGQSYRLRVEEDELDLDRFERLVARAEQDLEAGRADSASGRIREALATLAGAGAGRPRRRAARPRGGRPARGAAPPRARAAQRRRARARPPCRARRRAREPRRRAPVPRPAAAAAGARALPLRPPEGSARGVPGRAPGARRGARDRALAGAA